MSNFDTPPPQHDSDLTSAAGGDDASQHHESRAERRLRRELDDAIPPSGGAPITSELPMAFSDDVAMGILVRHLSEDEPDATPQARANTSPQVSTNIGIGANVPVGGINVNAEIIASLPGQAASHMEDVGVRSPTPDPVPGDLREAPTAPLTPAAMSAARNVAHAVLPSVVHAAPPTASRPPEAVPASLEEQIHRARRAMGTTDGSDH